MFEEYVEAFRGGLMRSLRDEKAWHMNGTLFMSFSPYLYRQRVGGPACDWAGTPTDVERIVQMMLPAGMSVLAKDGVIRGDYQLMIRRPGGRVPSWS